MNLHLALGVISVTNISTVTFSKPFSLITSIEVKQTLLIKHCIIQNYGRKIWWIW